MKKDKKDKKENRKPRKDNKDLPVIFILDMDRTLIGVSDMMFDCVEVVEFARSCCASKKITNLPCPKKVTFQEMFQPEFIRPGVKDMLDGIKQMYPTSEIFIYSAGSQKYVAECIALVENNTGVTFNRPLFSREQCVGTQVGYKKSIVTHLPQMMNVLTNKYPGLKDPVNQEKVTQYRLAFIDDKDVIWDMTDKWIRCPDYLYKPIIDITKYVDRRMMQHPLLRAFNAKGVLRVFFEPDEGEITDDDRNLLYHVFMADCYGSNLPNNRNALNDKFCLHLLNAIKPYKGLVKPFTAENIGNISKYIEEQIELDK